jgi:transposase
MKIVELPSQKLYPLLGREKVAGFWWLYPGSKTDLGRFEVPRIVAPGGSTRVKFFNPDLPAVPERRLAMDALLENCSGIDVHQRTIVVCLMVGKSHEKAKKTVKTFSTMTRDLLACKDWLESQGCTHVALESTGVYGKPVFNILEGSMEVILANARDIKNVPGRKTDVKDCEWIAQLLRHGLIQGSFIPPKPIRELRDLTRYRQKLIQQKASEINRLQKFMEDGNIKLASVVSDIHGRSAQEMIEHLIQDDLTAKEMAELAKGSLRSKLSELESALEGSLTDHHRVLFKISLQMMASFEEAIEKLNEEIDRKMEPYHEISERLQSIPGVKKNLLRSSLPKSEWI